MLIKYSEFPDWSLGKNYIQLPGEKQQTYKDRIEKLHAKYAVSLKNRGRLYIICREKNSKQHTKSAVGLYEKEYITADNKKEIEEEIKRILLDIVNRECDKYGESETQRNKLEGLVRWLFTSDRCPICYQEKILHNAAPEGMTRCACPIGAWNEESKVMEYKEGFAEYGGIFGKCVCAQ